MRIFLIVSGISVLTAFLGGLWTLYVLFVWFQFITGV